MSKVRVSRKARVKIGPAELCRGKVAVWIGDWVLDQRRKGQCLTGGETCKRGGGGHHAMRAFASLVGRDDARAVQGKGRRYGVRKARFPGDFSASEAGERRSAEACAAADLQSGQTAWRRQIL